jgi:eukaryotic-like serine/threonine-protein kinase
MTAEIEQLFHTLADLSPDARAQYLAEHEIDGETRREVEALLAFDSGASAFLAREVSIAAGRALPQLDGKGLRCGPYRLLDTVGRGGMGTVYLAERVDGEVTQRAAVKLLAPGAGEIQRERFLRERQILASLSHPNIARMLDAGHLESGQPFLAMEYVDGEPIDVFAADMSVRDKIALFLKVCAPVAYLHRNQVVHRDLKPSNILVTGAASGEPGEPKLLDFGIAKLLDIATDSTLTSLRMLTPDYASPEQVAGKGVSTASDIYSLGAVLYKLLTGKPAHEFDDRSAEGIAHTVTTREVTRPSKWAPELKGDLESILLKALRKDPHERYANVNEFAEDLEAYLASRAVRARSGTAWYRARKFLRRNRAAAAVLLMAAGLGWWRLHQSGPIPIAVLPLDNLSHDPANDYFTDGLTDELIRNLSLIEGLAPRSRTSSFAFKGKPRNVRDAAKELGVDYILEGSVLRVGQRLRIDAQLIRVHDDFPLWSGKFDRELTDVFAIQDEIARGIVNNLRLRLGRGRRRYETSVEAYDTYLRAQAQVEGGFPGYKRSIPLFEEAIAKDPTFAPAYAGEATAYVALSGDFLRIVEQQDELERMRAAAEKAIQLDPLSAEAHDAAASVYARDGNWQQSEHSFRRALELDPNRSTTRDHFALNLLIVLGRTDEAVREMRVAEKSDPLSPEVQNYLAYVLTAARRYDEAASHCEKLADDYPDKAECLGRARLGQGRIEEALQVLAPLRYRGNGGYLDRGNGGYLGYAYARAGHRTEAEKMAVEIAPNPFNEALVYAGLGDKKRTLDALDRMTKLGPIRIGRALTFPEFAFVRDDPRIKDVRKAVGLPY